MGSRVTRVTGFRSANFQFPVFFPSRLTGTGQTDGRTDRRQPSFHYVPTLWGAGIIIFGTKHSGGTLDQKVTNLPPHLQTVTTLRWEVQ